VALGVAAVAAGALAQAVTGFGFALVCAPSLVALLGSLNGVRLTLVLSAAVDLVVLAPEARQVQAVTGALLTLPALVVVPPAAWVARHLDAGVLAVAAGGLIVTAAAVLAAGWRAPRLAGRLGALVAGAAAGVMNTIAGTGGPSMAMWAANAGWPVTRARPTFQASFLMINLAGLATLGLPPLHLVALPLLGLLAGTAAGTALARRLPEPAVRRAALALAAAGGLAAIARGLIMG
jgi:uncharacterized membrane protein YfcA